MAGSQTANPIVNVVDNGFRACGYKKLHYPAPYAQDGNNGPEASCRHYLNNFHGLQYCDESNRFIDFAGSGLHKIRIPPTRPNHAERFYTDTPFYTCVVTTTGKHFGVRLQTATRRRPGGVRNGPYL